MKDKEFNELLKQIEDGSFTGSKLRIKGLGDEEGDKIDALDDNKAVLLAKALKKNPNITDLDLANNNIGDIGATALASVNTIQHFCVDLNNLTVVGLVALAHGNFKKLDLGLADPNDVSTLDKNTMTDAFIANKTIIDLSFKNCGLEKEWDDTFAKLVKYNSTIKHLNLQCNRLSDDVLKYIEYNTTLEELNLFNNKITDKGCEYLSKNHGLKTLVLGNNEIVTNIGGKLLSMHPTLESISLNGYRTTIGQLREIFSSIQFPSDPEEIQFDDEDSNLSGDMEYTIDDIQ